MTCPNCKGPAPTLIQNEKDVYVCALCLPDDCFKPYPKWREYKARAIQAVETHRKRSAQARKNFGKEVAA